MKHGYQAHPGYLDCKKCKKVMESVKLSLYGEDNLWRITDVVDNEDQGNMAYILLTTSQLLELHRQLTPIVGGIRNE